MKHLKMMHWLGLGGALLLPSLAVAALDIPNTFVAGDPVSASGMNENFNAVKVKVDALEADLGRVRACTYQYASCSLSVSCAVSCPSGTKVTGGGGACAPSNDQNTSTENRLKYTRPDSALSSWSVVCTDATKTAWAYAVCCGQ